MPYIAENMTYIIKHPTEQSKDRVVCREEWEAWNHSGCSTSCAYRCATAQCGHGAWKHVARPEPPPPKWIPPFVKNSEGFLEQSKQEPLVLLRLVCTVQGCKCECFQQRTGAKCMY